MKKFLNPEIEILELKRIDVICTSVTVVVPEPINPNPDGGTGF